MTAQFDTLALAQKLRAAGISQKVAEAHASAIRDHVMPELATRTDIADLKHQIERLQLTLTVRLGGLIVIGVGVLAALKLLP